MTSITRACAVVMVMCWACVAFALTPATLVGPSLQPEHVTLVGLSQGELSYFDADRNLQTTTIAGHFVQLRDIGAAQPTAPSPEQSVLTLVDGQRWIGQWVGWSKDGQSVRWRPMFMGKQSVTVPLERIASLHVGGGKDATHYDGRDAHPTGAGVATNDRVVLANGDAVAGFITRFAGASTDTSAKASPTPAGTIQLQQSSGQTLPIPLKNVRAILLANPPQPPTRGDMLFLRGGSRVLASDLRIKDDQVRFPLMLTGVAGAKTLRAPVDSSAPGARSLSPSHPENKTNTVLKLQQLTRIDFIGAGWRVVPLADLAWSVRKGGDVFGLPYPPRVGGQDMAAQVATPVIHLHAPVTVAFNLPEHAVRFVALASLNLGDDVPAPRRALAGFDVIVRTGEAQPPRGLADSPAALKTEGLSRTQINTAHPSAPINFVIPPGSPELFVQLDPGDTGPILDRLALRHALVLVANH